MLVWSKFRFGQVGTRNTAGDKFPRPSGYVPVPVQHRESLSYNVAYSVISELTKTGSMATYAMYFGSYKNDDFCDWKAFTTNNSGTDAAAYLRTGHMTFGDSARMKYAPWLTIEFTRTELSVSGSVA